jgi:membrane-associated phospholipid phosphatase
MKNAPKGADRPLAGGVKRLAPFHLLTLLFVLGLALVTILWSGRIPAWPTQLIYYALLLAVLAAVTLWHHSSAGKASTFIYVFSPILFIISIYESLGNLIQYLGADIDSTLMQIDHAVFGVYPTVWMERWIVPWLTDLMSLAYLSYYFIPVALVGILYCRNRMEELRMSLSVLALSYYVSFVGYILFPAIGPRFTMIHLQSVPLEGSFITDFVRDVLNALEHNKRDCMPSGHTQIALTVLFLAARSQKTLFYLLIPVITGLILSTIYLRYHYVVDLFAGAALAAVCFRLGSRFHRWWTGMK